MGTSGTGDGQVIGEILSDALLDSLPRGVVAVGPDRRIVHVNAAAERLFGRASADVVGASVDELLPDGYDAAYTAVVHGPAATGNGAPAWAPVPLRGVHPDGTPIPLEATLAPFETGSGTGVVALLDVSDVALGLDPPDVRLAVLEAGVEASDDAIFSHDPETLITSWNRSAERIFGYPAAEAVGRLAAMLFPNHVQPDIVVLLDTVLAGDRVHHFETEARRKDGMQLPISLSISPVVDGGGRTAGSVLIARDITEQRVAQATLAEIESRVRETEARVHSGSWLWDVGSGVVQWTDELHRIHDLDPLEFEGTLDAHLSFVHADDRDRVRATLEQAVATGRPFDDEHRILRSDGSTRWIYTAVESTHGSDGTVIGLRGMSVDVTQRHAAAGPGDDAPA